MRLIYLSTDELNQSLVRAWCGLRGIDVECPLPKDRAQGLTRGSLLVDLDHTTPDWLSTLAQRLEASWHSTSRIAVHGSSSALDAFRSAFRNRQLAVSSRLCAEVLREFTGDSSASASETSEDESEAVTWIDLA
jgi:hypothetical protein